jgi:hypothetical protein
MLVYYGGELLAPHPTPKLEYHPLSAIQLIAQKLAATLISIHNQKTSSFYETQNNSDDLSKRSDKFMEKHFSE